MGNSSSSSSMKESIRRQEAYVSANFDKCYASANSSARGYGSSGSTTYSANQVRGKLRQEFHGGGRNNDYVLNQHWSSGSRR